MSMNFLCASVHRILLPTGGHDERKAMGQPGVRHRGWHCVDVVDLRAIGDRLLMRQEK
jgi:hypothetical protein